MSDPRAPQDPEGGAASWSGLVGWGVLLVLALGLLALRLLGGGC